MVVVASATVMLPTAACTAPLAVHATPAVNLPAPAVVHVGDLGLPAPAKQPAVRTRHALRGTDRWRLSKPALQDQIEGYANPVSVLPGAPVRLMVSTSARHFRAYAYRIGAYRGGDGRLIWSSKTLPGLLQPLPALTPLTRTVVAHWSPTLRVRTVGWPAGFYLFKLVASSGYQAYVPLTVRSASTRGRVALVAPVLEWQAYNTWGGYDLYQAPAGQTPSWAVSFDRPYPAPGANRFLYNVRPAVVLAERLHLPLAYETAVDVATRPRLLRGAVGYVSLGHDEYWTVPERRYVTAARDHATNLVFLSSNTMYWRVRLVNARSGPRRLMVGYKADAGAYDPLRFTRPALTTARWRDPPHPDPENSLTGTLYECFPVDQPYRVASPHWWGFRGTGVHVGSEFPHLVADEADRVYPIPSTPRPLQVLSYLRYDCDGVLTSSESTYYTSRSGAGVVDFGSQRWVCALGHRCAGLPRKDDRFARKVTGTVLRAFSRGPAGRVHPAHDNVSRFWLPRLNQVPAS